MGLLSSTATSVFFYPIKLASTSLSIDIRKFYLKVIRLLEVNRSAISYIFYLSELATLKRSYVLN